MAVFLQRTRHVTATLWASRADAGIMKMNQEFNGAWLRDGSQTVTVSVTRHSPCESAKN
jgi:hypothetical protein